MLFYIVLCESCQETVSFPTACHDRTFAILWGSNQSEQLPDHDNDWLSDVGGQEEQTLGFCTHRARANFLENSLIFLTFHVNTPTGNKRSRCLSLQFASCVMDFFRMVHHQKVAHKNIKTKPNLKAPLFRIYGFNSASAFPQPTKLYQHLWHCRLNDVVQMST